MSEEKNYGKLLKTFYEVAPHVGSRNMFLVKIYQYENIRVESYIDGKVINKINCKDGILTESASYSFMFDGKLVQYTLDKDRRLTGRYYDERYPTYDSEGDTPRTYLEEYIIPLGNDKHKSVTKGEYNKLQKLTLLMGIHRHK